MVSRKVNSRKQILLIGFVILVTIETGLAFGQGQSSAGQQTQSPNTKSSSPAPSLGKTQTAPAAKPQVAPEEQQAYMAIQKEVDPDKQIQLVKDFQQKYPKSQLLSNVLFFGAGAAEQKNDVPDALNYGQKSLQLQPDNLRSLILVADLLPLPQALQGSVTQKEQQLGQSESDANHALQLLSKLTPPTNVSPAQFSQGKKTIEAQLHASLGMAHLEKAVLVPSKAGAPDATELSAAEQEFKTAVSSPQPVPQDYYRLGEVYSRENKLDEAIAAFTQAAQLGKGTALEHLASAKVSQLQTLKKSQPPAKSNQAPAPDQQ